MPHNEPIRVEQLDAYRFRIPKTGAMRTDGILYATPEMLVDIQHDNALIQVANMATLPGIVGNALAMPDIHWGYGFPIGGVAAFDLNTGVISPGGIGYDINCGVRVMRTRITRDVVEPKCDALLAALFDAVPAGVGEHGNIQLTQNELRDVVRKGALWAVEQGFGENNDLFYIEEHGTLADADPSVISENAFEHGTNQLGTLGSGNHFLEIQYVSEIFDEKIAQQFGMFLNQVIVMVHTGSRRFGYQVCDDYLRVMARAAQKYGIELPDKQLACAPIQSSEGKEYFAAMCGAANYAFANRQCIAHQTRECFRKVLGLSPEALGMQTLYDICHNIGKIETHTVKGNQQKVLVHRKGATRSFPAGRREIPDEYRAIGQPVLTPGTMGTSSYILVGTEEAMQHTFGSICHGAGRVMSRMAATKKSSGQAVEDAIKQKGIHLKHRSFRTLVEEAPFAYKNVDAVVDVCHNAGIARRVAKLLPMGVIKP